MNVPNQPNELAALSSHVLPPIDVHLRPVHIRGHVRAQNVDDLRHLVVVPRRRNGICATILSVPGDRIAVSISPGAMALTRMPRGPKSEAISRVREASAALDVA